MKLLQPKWITLVIVLLFWAASNSSKAGGDEYPVCKEVPASIRLTIKNPVAEIELRPDCWSSLIVLADYVKSVNTSYFGKTKPRALYLVGVTVIDGIPVAIMFRNKFRLRGDGKFTIKIFRYVGADT
jgi:hypothetical protein